MGTASSTINYLPSIIYLQSSISSHLPSMINHIPSTIYHQSSILNHQPSTINHQSSTINHHPSIINLQRSTINHQPCVRNSTTWLSDRAGGERLGESHLCKTMAPAVPSITNIYSLSGTLPLRAGLGIRSSVFQANHSFFAQKWVNERFAH